MSTRRRSAMRTMRLALLLLLIIGIPSLHAQVAPSTAREQVEEIVDSTESVDSGETVTTSTTTTSVTVTSNLTSIETAQAAPPGWIDLVRLAAVAGPVAFLLLAWMIGAVVHYRLVHREQAQFPVMRGSRAPQTVPMVISAALFFVPVALFVFFEIRAREELRVGLPGVIDEWQPVHAQAWASLLVCLVLALLPWLFARRADTVS